MPENDALLISALKKDPERVLAEIVDQYSAYVYTVVKNKMFGKCRECDIEETVGDVFAGFYKSCENFDVGKGTLKGYLAALAVHKAVDKIRNIGKCEAPLSLDDESFSEAVISDSDPQTEVERLEENAALAKAVKSLGEPDATIILRRYWLGETAAQTARVLSMTPNAVQKRANSALGKLRDILEGKAGKADKR